MFKSDMKNVYEPSTKATTEAGKDYAKVFEGERIKAMHETEDATKSTEDIVEKR